MKYSDLASLEVVTYQCIFRKYSQNLILDTDLTF